MGQAKRRRERGAQQTDTRDEWIKRVLPLSESGLAVIEDIVGTHGHVLIGPVMPRAQSNDPPWFFITATSDAEGFFATQLGAPNQKEAEIFRQSVFDALVQQRPPLVLHDFNRNDEMIRWAKGIWPDDPRAQAL